TAIPLGGNALLIGNLELRFPIIGFLGGALFYDIGNVFDSITRLGRAGFSNAVGFGLSISTPVGPIRLDLAYNPDPPDVAGFKRWLFHVNLGQPF
ncbi:MAG TPA: BamA/TamA family outer membrane protein, partial [Acidobacteriota bacterium]|nr:BamA/TamA family outer membrane protein [Acidobacteriota bacterium]